MAAVKRIAPSSVATTPCHDRVTRVSTEAVRGDATDFRHHIRADPGASRRGDDRFRVGRLLQALRPMPTGAQERVEPAHALAGVDVLEQVDLVAGELQSLGKPPLDESDFLQDQRAQKQ